MDVLIEQTYGTTPQEREMHYAYLARAFGDPRYIRVDGKPLFQIYIPEDIDGLGAYVEGLRSFVQKQVGAELHISATIRNRRKSYDYLTCFDSLTLAQPTVGLFSDHNIFAPREEIVSLSKFFREKILGLPLPLKKLVYTIQDLVPKRPTYFDYDEVWKNLLQQTENAMRNAPLPINFGAFSEFDNTPRYRESAKVIEGFTPQKFEAYLRALRLLARTQPSSILFINAWNEWGEGMHLEGDEKFPTERLQAVRNALCGEHG